jgi:hypothetical protein
MIWFKSSAIGLADHDLSENRVTATSTAWRHVNPCPNCKEHCGHQERMTDICLKCGHKSSIIMSTGAQRSVVRGGKWVPHLLYNGRNYIKKNGVWEIAR